MINFFYFLCVPKLFRGSNFFSRLFNKSVGISSILTSKLVGLFIHFYPSCKKSMNNEPRDIKVIVNMTTIESRIKFLPYVLKSIFNQTVMPDKVIIWLDEKMGDCARTELYSLLANELKNNLELCFVKDVKVHTKYYYCLQKNRNCINITIDDDIYYSEKIIENLLKTYNENKHSIVCKRVHKITFINNKLKPYRNWIWLDPSKKCKSNGYIATGVGAVLYPPNIIPKEAFNEELFLKLCPNADDIWLKFIEAKNNISVVKCDRFIRENMIINKTQKIALSKSNVIDSKNDKYINDLLKYYNLKYNIFLD